jgi:CspA family cold shock protein
MLDEGVHEGIVREWHEDDGWGVVETPDLPGACWVHFSVIEMSGYRVLTPGARVRLVVEVVEQDGFACRATRVVPA